MVWDFYISLPDISYVNMSNKLQRTYISLFQRFESLSADAIVGLYGMEVCYLRVATNIEQRINLGFN